MSSKLGGNKSTAVPGSDLPPGLADVDFKEGDILVREGPEDDSIMIMEITGMPYSHGGMVVRDPVTKLLLAIDNYPGRNTATTGSINTLSLKEWFNAHHAKSGLVLRYSDEAIAKKAADWALSQIPDKDYD